MSGEFLYGVVPATLIIVIFVLVNGWILLQVKSLKEVERLDFDEIANWIIALGKRFHITDGLFDRWNGIPLEQALMKRGMSQFKAEFFTRDMSSRIYQNAKLMMFDRKLKLYDWPLSDRGSTKHSPFIYELLSLQAQQVSRNVTVVEAPDTVGYFDDMSDAFVRAVWLSSQRLADLKIILGGSHSPTTGRATMSPERYQLMRARRHGGGFADRVVPKFGRVAGRRMR